MFAPIANIRETKTAKHRRWSNESASNSALVHPFGLVDVGHWDGVAVGSDWKEVGGDGIYGKRRNNQTLQSWEKEWFAGQARTGRAIGMYKGFNAALSKASGV
jgi:hypothetical protein